jgi:hypothetical protein
VKTRIAPLMFAVVLAASANAAAKAQVPTSKVGYPPTSSPYVDLEHAQELTLIVGSFHAHRDPANAGPQSGTTIGAHYEWRAGGPAHLMAELAYMTSDRRLINPAKAGAARELGTTSRPLYSADVGLGLSLTGGKSWHRFVPEVSGGLGLISDFRTSPDSGGFKFGTRFALTGSAGLRYVPGGRWQIRGDIKDRMYTLAYPSSYYIAPTGGTAVLSATQARSFWTHNPTLSLGLSYLF